MCLEYLHKVHVPTQMCIRDRFSAPSILQISFSLYLVRNSEVTYILIFNDGLQTFTTWYLLPLLCPMFLLFSSYSQICGFLELKLLNNCNFCCFRLAQIVESAYSPVFSVQLCFIIALMAVTAFAFTKVIHYTITPF